MSGDLKTCLDDPGLQIVRELYRAFEMLGANPGLLSSHIALSFYDMSVLNGRERHFE